MDKLIGEKIDAILNNSNKTIFICQLEKPLVLHKRIIIAAPPLTEHENGFSLWLNKFTKLAQELSIPMHIYCTEATQKAMDKLLKKSKSNATVSFTHFTDWEDFLVLSRYINDDDLFVLVSARKGATSYMSVLDNLPAKLKKYFNGNSRFVIYPQEFEDNYNAEPYNEFSSEPLNKGIEAVQKISKGFGSFLKKKE